MRIEDEQGNELDRVSLALTDAEAGQLRDYLGQLLVEKPFHAHVMDDRFWSENEADRVEREIIIYRSDDPQHTKH